MANVIIKNKLPQTITVSVIDDNGIPQPVKIDAYASSEPVDASRLTNYTNNLAQRTGAIRILPAA